MCTFCHTDSSNAQPFYSPCEITLNYGRVYDVDAYRVTSCPYFIVTNVCYSSYRNGISWRRAKKLMKHFFLHGSSAKANVKWSGYEFKIGYSRKRRAMFFIQRTTLDVTRVKQKEEVDEETTD